MRAFTVGCVPYVNGIPLVARFELEPDPPVSVIYAVPSALPALLEEGTADAILVSSVDGLRHNHRRMVDGVCVGSSGPVKSVRLFSKVPPSAIRSLALDQSSMTSNRLALALLAQKYGVVPASEAMPPHQATMLAEHDACVLIGDIGMTAKSDGLFVLDLGAEFTEFTGKPFVWAAWIGGNRLTRELAAILREAAAFYPVGKTRGAARGDFRALVDHTRAKTGWDVAMIEDYYLDAMVYRMGEDALEGYRRYQRLLIETGFEDCSHFPELI